LSLLFCKKLIWNSVWNSITKPTATQTKMPQVIMMSLDKNMDLRTDGQFDMTNLSTEKIMNKITKITKKKKKKIKLIKPKEETITIEPTNFKYPNRCSKIWNVEKQKEEDDEDEDSDCVAHPVYNCDGGCGTIMGSDDDCKRICDDCKEEEESDDDEEKQCADCEIEAKKHCDECGGYGSCSDDDEEDEDDEETN
jgi:hypothetical protein